MILVLEGGMVRVRPAPEETEQGFVSRADGLLKNDIPSDKARTEVAFALWKHRDRLKNAADDFPKMVKIRHLEPGPVFYEYMRNGAGAMVLVTRDYLERIRHTAEGKPIINRTHRDLPKNPIARGEGDGIITRAYNDPSDGWDWVDAIIWDEATVQNIRNGYSASCQHELTQVGEGGIYHAIPYDMVALDGFYEHIAIVPKGRYEGVRILMMNSKEGGKTMKINLWPFNKDTKETAKNAVEVETEKASLDIGDGKVIPLQDAVAAYQEKLKNEADAKAIADAAKAANSITDGDVVQLGDKQVTVGDLKAAYRAKNEADEKAKKDKEAEDAKNAEDEAEKKKKEDEDKKEDAKNAAALASAAAARREPMPFTEPQSLQERAAKGREMFGSAKAA